MTFLPAPGVVPDRPTAASACASPARFPTMAIDPMPLRVVLADDHDLVRSGVRALLGMIEGVQVVGEAREGAELVAVVDSLRPDVVLTDLSMPGLGGLDAIATLHARHPEIRVLVLSMHDGVDTIKRALASGACGYLMKDAPTWELEQALRGVARDGVYLSTLMAQRLQQPGEPTVDDVLTTRQVEILRMIAQGKAAKEIAFELGLSPKTVDVHRARIMERLGINDVASLTRYAIRKGLVEP